MDVPCRYESQGDRDHQDDDGDLAQLQLFLVVCQSDMRRLLLAVREGNSHVADHEDADEHSDIHKDISDQYQRFNVEHKSILLHIRKEGNTK